MSQNRQIKKVKKYRTLKVVFYFLGLPLFILAVLLTSIRFIGRDPFLGESTLTNGLGFLTDHEALITSPALFGIWLAVGVWLVISLFHLLVNKAVKSRRVRMFSVLAFALVIMLGGTLAMDTVFDAQINTMIEEHAGDGSVIPDYRTQLSYYRTLSSNAKNSKNETRKLIDRVRTVEKVYNVEYYGINKSGVAGNIANKPATYANVIDDEGNTGVDISFVRDEDGKLQISYEGDGDMTNDETLIRLAPNANGYLEINGVVYTKYFYCKRTLTSGEEIFVWYPLLLMPTSFDWNPAKGTGSSKPVDGVYGEGLYNRSGTLSDGWVFSVMNLLDILEDYYEAEEYIAAHDPDGSRFEYEIYPYAELSYQGYYDGTVADPTTGELIDPWLKAHYAQQADYEERFSITNGELNSLIAQLGRLIGDNSLFTFLFGSIEDVGSIVGSLAPESNIGSLLKPLLDDLAKGYKLSDLLGSFGVAGADETIKTVFSYLTDQPVNDIYLTLAYKKNDAFGVYRDHLYLAVINHDPAKGDKLLQDEILLDIDFTDAVIDPETGEYAFDFDNLSDFLNKTLNYLIGTKLNLNLSDGILNTILGLFLKDMEFDGRPYKGLDISGIQIPLLEVLTVGESEQWIFNVDINGILENLLGKFYDYQSPAIMPMYEFYDWHDVSAEGMEEEYAEELIELQKMYKQYERAKYEATIYGTMIGSTLIGDNLGTGAYPSALGLTDLASVRQLKTDLSYKPVYYPLFAFRDMMLMFSGIVVLFYFFSFVAAEKEEKYATGEIIPRGGDLTDYDYMVEPDEHVVIHERVTEQTLYEGDAAPVTQAEMNAEGGPKPKTSGKPPKRPSDKNKRKGGERR